VIHHWEWITKNVNSKYPIFNSRLVSTGILAKLGPLVLPPNNSGHCQITSMIATGVPPHIEISRELLRAKERIQELEITIVNQHVSLKTDLPALLGQYLKDNFTLNGVQQLTKVGLEVLLKNCLKDMSPSFSTPSSPAPVEAADSAHFDDSGYPYYCWGSKLRGVPEGFKFPRGSLKMILNLFFTGMSSPRVKPFRFLKSKDLAPGDGSYLSKATSLFKTFSSLAIKHNLVTTHHEFCQLQSDAFDSMYPTLLADFLAVEPDTEQPDGRRQKRKLMNADSSYVTCYDNM